MRSMVSVVSIVILVVVASAAVLLAQPPEGKNAQLYMFWEIVVHPDKVAQFEEAAKKQVALYQKHDFAYPWSTSSTDDNHYYFGIPIDNYAMMDPIFEAFAEYDKKLGEESKALEAAFEGTVESERAQMWSLDYDLSFYPENARITTRRRELHRLAICLLQTGIGEASQRAQQEMECPIQEQELERPRTRFGLETLEPRSLSTAMWMQEKTPSIITPGGLSSTKSWVRNKRQ